MHNPVLGDARGVYEALYLLELALDKPPYNDADYRTGAARVRFAANTRDLAVFALEDWAECP